MHIFYTKHAKEKMEERSIEPVWVESTIQSPDSIERKTQAKYMVKKKLNGKSLKVVYAKERYIKILTVYWI